MPRVVQVMQFQRARRLGRNCLGKKLTNSVRQLVVLPVREAAVMAWQVSASLSSTAAPLAALATQLESTLLLRLP